MKGFYLIVLLFTLSFNVVYTDMLRETLVQKMWEGRQAAGEGDFERAKKLFIEVNENARKNDPAVFKSWDLDEEIRIIEELIHLKVVENPQKYRVLVVFVKETSARMLDKDGNFKNGYSRLSEEETIKTKVFFEYQKQMIRAFSEGHLVVEMEYAQTPFKVVRMDDLRHKRVNVADVINLEPNKDFRRFLYEKYNDYDVFCFVWSKPFGRTQAEGGIGLHYALLPYIYRAPQRGYMVIPANWCVDPFTRHTFVHELFHTIEYNLGIFPSHGWMKNKRALIPDFTGETQYDFYSWRFKRDISKYPWDQINYRERFRLKLKKGIFENYLKLYDKYDFSQNEKAYKDYRDGKIEDGLRDYPDHPLLLLKKSKILIKHKRYGEADSIARRLYRLDPSKASFVILNIKTRYYLGDDEGLYELIYTGINNKTFGFWDRLSAGHYLTLAAKRQKYNSTQDKFYNLLVALDPQNNKFLRRRARFYLDILGSPEMAATDYRSALENFPNDPLSAIGMGKVYLRQKQYDEAEKYFQKALANTPYFAQKVAKAYIFASYSDRDLENKKYLVEKAIFYDPNYHQSYRDYAFLLRALGKNDEALEYFKKSVDLGNSKSFATIKKYYGFDYKPHPKAIRPNSEKFIKVGVYEIYKGLMKEFEEHLVGVSNITIVRVTTDDIISGKLSDIDVLISPGGNPSDYAKQLDTKGMRVLRNYIKSGGNFIGICAGSFFAIDSKYLDLIDAVPFNQKYWNRGTGDVNILLTEKGRKVFGDLKDPFRIRYSNGTMMEPFDKPQMESYEVLARFTDGLAENGAPDIMRGREAIVLSRYGKGKILLFIPHPEYTPGKGYLIRKAVYYLVR